MNLIFSKKSFPVLAGTFGNGQFFFSTIVTSVLGQMREKWGWWGKHPTIPPPMCASSLHHFHELCTLLLSGIWLIYRMLFETLGVFWHERAYNFLLLQMTSMIIINLITNYIISNYVNSLIINIFNKILYFGTVVWYWERHISIPCIFDRIIEQQVFHTNSYIVGFDSMVFSFINMGRIWQFPLMWNFSSLYSQFKNLLSIGAVCSFDSIRVFSWITSGPGAVFGVSFFLNSRILLT